MAVKSQVVDRERSDFVVQKWSLDHGNTSTMDLCCDTGGTSCLDVSWEQLDYLRIVSHVSI